MHINARNILNFFEESIGDLLVGIGALFFLVGLLSMTSFYQWVTAIALFSGVILFVSGLAIRLEGPLTLTKPSISGFGSILIYISLITIASAGILALFATPEGMTLIESVSRGTITHRLILHVAYPFAWLVKPLGIVGIGLLVFGVLLKFRDIF